MMYIQIRPEKLPDTRGHFSEEILRRNQKKTLIFLADKISKEIFWIWDKKKLFKTSADHHHFFAENPNGTHFRDRGCPMKGIGMKSIDEQAKFTFTVCKTEECNKENFGSASKITTKLQWAFWCLVISRRLVRRSIRKANRSKTSLDDRYRMISSF